MDFFYKVEMKHQWRLGIGGFVDLNCGWYCQDALLGWYCKKNNIPDSILKGKVKRNRLSYGFSPEGSFCHKILIPSDIECYKKALLKHGPIIASGKLGMADFGFLGGVNHYVLIVGVNTKRHEIILHDPLNINTGRASYANHGIYNFYRVVGRIDETLVINTYTVNLYIA
ncbi:TPA: kinesin [Yersinia enterocolitica]|nr:kinesin [Yersinia enterocolitica]HDL7830233.1 kinesin [Yersinia enterocolitica]HDL7871089.1 kinesin [Yersinia enterocolitica]HDL7884773.1 kinesin [Yersinia enterocolitica]HDL7892265.1 kinesin [Yersinia enterocolitica]